MKLLVNVDFFSEETENETEEHNESDLDELQEET